MIDIKLVFTYNIFFNMNNLERSHWNMLFDHATNPDESICKALGAKLNKHGEPIDRQLRKLNNCFIDAIYHREMSFVMKIYKVIELRITELRKAPIKIKGVQTVQAITYYPSKANLK